MYNILHQMGMTDYCIHGRIVDMMAEESWAVSEKIIHVRYLM